MGKEWRPARRIVKSICGAVTQILSLLGILIVGYALLPLINFAFKIFIPGTEIGIGMVVFVIFAAVFSFAAFRFIGSVLARIGLTPDKLARFMPGTFPSHVGLLRKLILQFYLVVIILIAYWVASPILNLIPGLGLVITATLQTVVGAIVVLFFWGVGRLAYRELEVAIGRIVWGSEAKQLPLGKVGEKALKVVISFLVLIGVLVLSYTFMPLLEFSSNILIPVFGISLSLVISIIILGVLSLIAVRFITSAIALLGFPLETLTGLMPSLASPNARSLLHRIFLDLSFIILALIVYWVAYQLIVLIPGIGAALAAASQIVVAAIIVLLFWDIGRTLYNKLEEAASRISI
ncbi:MAG: hypothetical protein QXJ75_04625 [Candidatus Bathyarchaeia archaeon]